MQSTQPSHGSSPVVPALAINGGQASPQVSGASAIVSAKQESRSFFAILLYPLTTTGQFFTRIATYLLNNFLPFCACCSEGRMDWESTKEIFEEMRDAMTQEDKDEKDRAINFEDSRKALSPQALHRFEQQIGFAKAKLDYKLEDRAAQENWLNGNFRSINFYEDYYTCPIGNKVLLEGVENFWAEIQGKEKQS